MKVLKNFDLTGYNSYRIKSACEIAYFPENENDVCQLFGTLKEYVLLGSGHNVILSEEYYDKPFVIFNGNFNSFRLTKDGLIEAEAGAMMWDISNFACQHGLKGLEVFWDIPSSLGGAVVMNAGASGEEIKDVIDKVKFFDIDEKCCYEFNNEQINFDYRNSVFQQNKNIVILKAWLKLEKGEMFEIRSKMDLIKQQRWLKQPNDWPNAGSVFKRPKGFFVGTLIDELNLKGYTVGGAKVSEKHGGFIVNFNNGTGKDILNIVKYIQDRVEEVYGVKLEIEQRII